MTTASSRSRSAAQSGIALIIVMISILVLAVLAGGFATSMKVETMLARNANSEVELEWLGRSGVEYARWILGQQAACPVEPYDALSQVWAGGSGGPCTTNGPLADVQQRVQLGRGSFTWKITDLERKANINTVILNPANEEMLHQALILVGVEASEFPAITGAILDWIDQDDKTHIDGAESDYYHGLQPPYDAKNGPIDDITELLLVRGVTPEVFWGPASTNNPLGAIQHQLNRMDHQLSQPNYSVGLVDLFSPLSSGRININTASAEVLQLVPGVDNIMAAAIVSGRQGEDDGSGLLGPYPNIEALRRVPEVNPQVMNAMRQFCGVRSTTFEVQITATVGSYSRDFIAILRRNNPRDVQILTFYWK